MAIGFEALSSYFIRTLRPAEMSPSSEESEGGDGLRSAFQSFPTHVVPEVSNVCGVVWQFWVPRIVWYSECLRYLERIMSFSDREKIAFLTSEFRGEKASESEGTVKASDQDSEEGMSASVVYGGVYAVPRKFLCPENLSKFFCALGGAGGNHGRKVFTCF